MDTKIITGIITNKNSHSENDEMLTVATQTSLIYIYAKGVKKIESKNRPNIPFGAVVDFEVFKNYSSPNSFLLKKAILIKELPTITKNNSQKIQLIAQTLKKINSINNNNFFDIYLILLNNLEGINFYKQITFLFTKVLDSCGEGLSFIFCIICLSNQNLFSFDVYQGGILCKSHSLIRTEISLLKSFYYLGTSVENYIQKTTTKNNQILFNIFCNLLF